MNSKRNLENIILKNYRLDNDIKNEFLSLFKEIEIKKGDFFVKTNQYVSKLGFINSGIFRVYYSDIDGNDINNVFLLENDFIIGRLNPATKTLDINKIFSLAEKHHSISQLILKVASSYFDKNLDREISLRNKNATDNYLYFLNEYPNLINKIPHYYIADYLQISSTHLSRIRKELSSK